MEGKEQILTGLSEIFFQWQALIAALDEKQLTAPLTPSTWTIKDIIAHMWSWQQASVARMEAALADMDPMYPEWWKILGPDPEEDIDCTNAWLYKANQDKPWSQAYSDWKEQFVKYIELTKQIPEEDLLGLGRYAWMGQYALSASSMGSLEHHIEHYEEVKNWLQGQGILKAN